MMRSRCAVGALALALLAPAAATQAVLHTLFGSEFHSNFGHAVAGAGDVDGDGHADFAVGIRWDDTAGTDAGRVAVYSGRNQSLLHDLLGEKAFSEFGTAVAGVGDVDGDGAPDLLVGAPHHQPTTFWSPGRASLISGATGATLRTFDGSPGTNDWLGFSVAGPGDVDGDGVPDLLVGAPNAPDNSQPGGVYVYSGQDGSVLHAFFGDASQDGLGLQVGAAGDVDGDGFLDVVASSQAENGVLGGYVRAWSGATGALLHDLDMQGGFIAVAGIGDIDGDGHGDLLWGDGSDDSVASGAGLARVVSGQDGATLHTYFGAKQSDQLGLAVAAAGDVDDDGVPDFAVGAPFGFIFAELPGLVHVRSGTDGTPIHTLDGLFGATSFGWSIANAGDVNGDGRPDLVVGAPFHGSGAGNGAVRVFSASAQGLPPAEWVDLGGGTAGVAGVPALAMDGPLVVGSTLWLELLDGPPSALAFLFVSLAPEPRPFLGGTLHAAPFDALVLLATGPFGSIHGGAPFSFLAPGQQYTFQFGLVDPSVPVYGASLSNAVRGTAP